MENDMKKAKTPVILFWSGGKDSALTLSRLQKSEEYEVKCLFTTLDRGTNLVPFHGVKESILVSQSQFLAIPLQRVYLPANCSNEQYQETVAKFLNLYAKKGIKTVAFGDIFLEDIRKFREDFLAPLGFECLFPLWGNKTIDLAMEFAKSQFRAVTTSVNTKVLDASFLGKNFDEEFIARLPDGVDPCGENGEFHTFVSFGPGFKTRVPFSKSMGSQEGDYLIGHLKDA